MMTGLGKRSVKDKTYLEFCGWDKLKAVTLDQTIPQTTRELFSTIFLTGGRSSEVLTLRKEQFRKYEKEGYVLVQRMAVLKHGKPDERSFPIRLDEPLTNIMMGAINNTNTGERLFPYKYRWLYKHISTINKYENKNFGEWFPHRLRAERAKELVEERNYGIIELMSFFRWTTAEMAFHYAGNSPKRLIQLMMEGKL